MTSSSTKIELIPPDTQAAAKPAMKFEGEVLFWTVRMIIARTYRRRLLKAAKIITKNAR